MNRERATQSKIRWDPVTGEINDSRNGDYLWSCVNVGEAVSVVMTPFTYSFGHNCFSQFDLIPGISFTGNIGGRVYANRSLERMIQRSFGKLADNLKISTKELAGDADDPIDPAEQSLKLSKSVLLGKVMPKSLSMIAKHVWKARNVPGFIAGNPSWCRTMAGRIENIKTREEMATIWTKEINPYVLRAFHRVIATALRFGILSGKLRPVLGDMVGSADTDVLLTNANRNGEFLESLGPVVGLSRVANGKMPRDVYLDTWGHRGVLEIEAAAARPFEEDGWLDRELNAYNASKVDVDELLSKKYSDYEDAWQRLQMRYPRRAKGLIRRLEQCAAANRARESVRSEFIRLVWVMRSWARKSGVLAEIGDDAFFLTVEELLEILSGKDESTSYIPARKKTYERYKALPPYPPAISGPFDPFQWAKNLGQCDECSDSGEKSGKFAAVLSGNSIITGVPGSAGEAVGTVRLLRSLEEGDQLVDGEILVTSATNIGWTLLFPRVAAIVTDIGASL
ncbi:MAG: hypothetical protein Q7R50_04335, partial [Dehalococcoidales bacterium]|nr:hypothetical protein [Dehalococcoidales bacterium]